MAPVFECSNCGRAFYISEVASEVPGGTSGDVVCPHCQTVSTKIQPNAGHYVVTDRVPLERENALRQQKGLPPLQG